MLNNFENLHLRIQQKLYQTQNKTQANEKILSRLSLSKDCWPRRATPKDPRLPLVRARQRPRQQEQRIVGMGGRSGIRDKVGPDLDFQPLLHFPSPLLAAATTTVPGKRDMLCRGQLRCHRQSTEHLPQVSHYPSVNGSTLP